MDLNRVCIRMAFISAAVFCLTPWASPPVALVLGLLFAQVWGNPWERAHSRISRSLLQISIIGLGFGMNLKAAVQSSASGIIFTIGTIVLAMTAGLWLGRFLKVDHKIGLLISCGTAICGGSAIAAVSPVIDAREEETAVSMGTVFILNAVGLLMFPVIGRWLNLSPERFGMWAAIAIHDTSSVVGAAQAFGEKALSIAVNVKLTRALWIIPLVMVMIVSTKRKHAKIRIPWFIGGYILAMLIASSFPALADFCLGTASLAKKLLTLTLFFIGAGLTKRNLKSVGLRPLFLGIVLWLLISLASFYSIRFFY
jgi:uncharacterized integral membrane protein (TIGR00698 family)